MPSFTFVATANAFVLRGATPVFVDIRPDTLNLDEAKVEAAVTPRTRAIVPIHYAGVGCEMDAIMDIAARHGLLVVEDAAQGILARYKDRPLGSIGQMAALSFHETKNVQSGEGGALLLNDEKLVERAEIIREKGTNRSRFFRGQVDKYTWIDIGSSFLPGEIVAAFLAAQLEAAAQITRRRIAIWERYHAAFAELEAEGLLRRPVVAPGCTHNGHIYYLLLPSLAERTAFMQAMERRGVSTVFHYIPLHSSPGGRRFGRAVGELPVTDELSDRLVRLPLWVGFEEFQEQVIASIVEVLRG
jgi:dTDP-4-amino-4,6-dideoxygalactose transaminase